MTRALLAILGSALVLGLAAGPAVPAGQPPQASGGAYALKVIVPGQTGASVAEIGGPATTQSGANGFAYPADGSVARIGPATTTLTVKSGAAPTVQAGADISAVTLFNGEITVDGMTIRAAAGIRPEGATAGGEGSTVRNVLALGQAVPGSPGASAALADWGTLTVLPASAERTSAPPRFKGHTNVVGVHVVLTQPHGGLPAGSEILIGYADATAEASPPAAPPTTTGTTTTTTAKPAVKPPEQQGGADGAPGPPIFRELPTGVNAELTPGRYVFPVYGSVGFGNSFGAARASTGWHHGEDIFGTLGEPILAVADGTIFSVGWNNVGGFRFWLRDRAGNQFYYAHLSAYSPLAVNGREVRAGQVIAFMGNTGEARTTPVHLHFEIHPVSMLQFGYDGAIAPYPYLIAWQRLEDVSFAFGSSWVPLLSVTANAPKPGAILLSSQDISSASGLDPASLRRALTAPAGTGEGGVAGLLQG